MLYTSGQVISTRSSAGAGNGLGGAIGRPLLGAEAIMRVRPMRPEKTMHRAEHRVEDIAIKAGKAYSLLVDPVFPLCLWTLLIVLVIALAVAILVWC